MAELKRVGEFGVIRALADPSVMRVVCDPSAADEQKCGAIFGGAVLQCNGCAAEIRWPGVCDECSKRFATSISQMTIPQLLVSVGVPVPMSKASWEDWVEPRNLATAADGVTVHEITTRTNRLRDWNGIPTLVVISGPAGTGKTHLAVATVRRRIESKGHYGVLFITNERLIDALMNARDAVDAAWHARLLVIDDFGRGIGVDFKLDMLCSFICRRVDYGKPTILTTNLTGVDIKQIDERLHSRMYEGAVVTTRGLRDWRAA